MKKLTASLASIALFLSLVSIAFARTNYRHSPAPTPTPAPTSPITWGAFTANTTALGSYQAFFIGDGDSFTDDAEGFTKPLVVYWESNYSATQIASGKADSFLKAWATQMQAYPKQIIFDVLDEMNGNWSPYYGKP